MFKKILSVFLALTIAFGCLSMAVTARQVGVGGGAESFNPVEFYQDYLSTVLSAADRFL